MKRHTGLFPDVVELSNLLLASKKVLRAKKDRRAAATFHFNLENEVVALQEELIEGTYQPKPFRIFEIREPKVRRICSSHIRDRVVHHAVCNVLEPIFERRMIQDTYACRVGKGTHKALARCQFFSRKYAYYLKCDIRKYFDSIDHDILLSLLAKLIKDRSLLGLLEKIVTHSVPGNPDGKGVPIGNLTSQHYANLYLGELDHFLKERRQVHGYIRYMDDFICFSDDKATLHALLDDIRKFLADVLKLELKEKVTKIAPVSEGVPFLGFRVFRNLKRMQRPNLIRLRRKIRKREAAYQKGWISEVELYSSIQSMIAHISHADVLSLRRKEFERSLCLA